MGCTSPGSLYYYWEHWFFDHTALNGNTNYHKLRGACEVSTEPLILAPLTHQEILSIALVSGQAFPCTSLLNNPKAQKAIIGSSFLFSMYSVKLLFTMWLVHHRRNARSSSNAIQWCIMSFLMIMGDVRDTIQQSCWGDFIGTSRCVWSLIR